MSMMLPGKRSCLSKTGFSLIELMITVAVVSILAALSYPSYIRFIHKAERSDAKMTLQDWANQQEVWRADHPTYNSTIKPSNTKAYTYSMTSTATSFTLTATAIGRQAYDKEENVSCSTLTYKQDGTPGPDGYQVCWGN